MKPFDTNHARNYFGKRFSEEEGRVNGAMKVYDRFSPIGLQDSPGNFVGRGFILNLIADLVERSDTEPNIGNRKATVVPSLMNALCEREERRQKLPLNAKEQLDVFREFAEEVACGQQPTTDLLKLAIESSRAEQPLYPEQVENLVGGSGKPGSLHDHPLIRRLGPQDRWEFVHEQVFFNLLAQRLKDRAQNGSGLLRNLIENLKIEKGLMNDVAAALLDQLLSLGESESKTKNEIRQLIETIIRSFGKSGPNRAARGLVTTVAMLALNRLFRVGHERVERTKEFISYFPHGSLSRLDFAGTINSMDFRETRFRECVFNQVTWANCRFDQSTVFEHCDFFGGRTDNCEGFGEAAWKGGHFDSEAQANISSNKILAGRKKYSKEDLRHDIEQILKKFVPKEGVGFKSVLRQYMCSGTIDQQRCAIIVDSLLRHVLDENRVSGVSDRALHIRESARIAIADYVTNGVFTGSLGATYSELITKLKLD